MAFIAFTISDCGSRIVARIAGLWGLSLPPFLWSAPVRSAWSLPIIGSVNSERVVQTAKNLLTEGREKIATASWQIDRERVKREALRPFLLLLSGDPWRGAWFLVSNMLLGVLWFGLLTPFVLAGFVGLLVLIGFPILAAAMTVWTRGARRHRQRVEAISGYRVPEPYRPPAEGFFVRRL